MKTQYLITNDGNTYRALKLATVIAEPETGLMISSGANPVKIGTDLAQHLHADATGAKVVD